MRTLNPYRQGDTFDPTLNAWVTSEDQLYLLERAILTATEIVWDLETTGLDEHDENARIVLASFTLPQEGDDGEPVTWIVPLSHREASMFPKWQRVMTRLADKMVEAHSISGALQVGHNVKFDCRWVYAHTGVDLSPLIGWDTQVVEHLIDENQRTRLKVCAPRRFGLSAGWDDFDLSTPGAAERVPLIDLGLYAARDTYWTWRLLRAQRRDLWLDDDQDAFEAIDTDERQMIRLGTHATECVLPMLRNLTAVEQRGLALDVDWTTRMLSELSKVQEGATATLVARHPASDDPGASGEVSFAPTSKWFRSWAERAVEAGDLRVDAMTRKGAAQWNAAVLKRQAREGNDTAETLLKLRQASKQQEFLRGWLSQASHANRIHAQYNVGRVSTGRLSSSNPNFQQVTKALKPAFVPTPGYVIAEIDYSQIELRAAAFIARCEPMIEAYRRGDDLHRLMGATITGKRPEDVTPEERQKAKAANFGFLYMQTAEGFVNYAETAYGVMLTLEEAAHTRAAFFDQWKGMAEWHDRTAGQVRRYGYVTSPLGRVRRLDDGMSGDSYLVGQAERQGCNAPVQSFASDMMQIAAADVGGMYGDPVPEVRMVGTVHDSIVVEVPGDNWKVHVARVMRRMLNPHKHLIRLGCEFDVPLAAEATCGTRWGLGDLATIVSS